MKAPPPPQEKNKKKTKEKLYVLIIAKSNEKKDSLQTDTLMSYPFTCWIVLTHWPLGDLNVILRM